MKKHQLEQIIRIALDELETATKEAKQAAIKYGDSTESPENMAFEVGFLNARIASALYALKKSGLMSYKELFTEIIRL